MTHTAGDAIGEEPCRRDSACSLGERSGTISRPDEKTLIEAFSIIEDTPNIDGVVSKLRDLVHVDHVVYHSSKLGASPSDPQRGPYIRLTYPASWIMRYLQMGYADVDPVLREAFRRTIPFEWSELSLEREAEASFLADAGVEAIIGNFDEPMLRLYRRIGCEVEVLGSTLRYRQPVYLGLHPISEPIIRRIKARLRKARLAFVAAREMAA